jgi:hypothetical protein
MGRKMGPKVRGEKNATGRNYRGPGQYAPKFVSALRQSLQDVLAVQKPRVGSECVARLRSSDVVSGDTGPTFLRRCRPHSP